MFRPELHRRRVPSAPASVIITGSSATPVTVTVSTTAAGGTGGGPSATLPSGIGLLAWTMILGVSGPVVCWQAAPARSVRGHDCSGFHCTGRLRRLVFLHAAFNRLERNASRDLYGYDRCDIRNVEPPNHPDCHSAVDKQKRGARERCGSFIRSRLENLRRNSHQLRGAPPQKN